MILSRVPSIRLLFIRYGADIAASVFLFLVVSIAAGRMGRFAFDDEVFNLNVAEFSSSLKEVIHYFLWGGDMHPALSYVLHYQLWSWGVGETGLRVASVCFTLGALVQAHLISFLCLEWRGRTASMAVRLAAVFLFGLNALAISQGDAIRWYPLFSFLTTFFLMLAISAGERISILSSIPLGLAASTNFLAIFVYLPFAVYRYGFLRRFQARGDILFHVLLCLFALPGLVTFVSLSMGHGFLKSAQDVQFASSFPVAALTAGLGYFGSNVLGVSQAWMVLPFALSVLLVLVSETMMRPRSQPAMLLVMIIWSLVVMVLLGFSKSRSFLYIAPAVTALMVIFVAELEAKGMKAGVLALITATVAASVAAIANLNANDHPFKRNAAIPFQQAIDFIDANRRGHVLILSTDPVLARELRHSLEDGEGCVSYLVAANCLRDEKPFDSVFVIEGKFDFGPDSDQAKSAFDRKVLDVSMGLDRLAILPVGNDRDAELKTRFTHIPLDQAILTITLYSRISHSGIQP